MKKVMLFLVICIVLLFSTACGTEQDKPEVKKQLYNYHLVASHDLDKMICGTSYYYDTTMGSELVCASFYNNGISLGIYCSYYMFIDATPVDTCP